MNTDQAFDLLKDAGVTEDNSIQTVRRWLREGKIKFNGKVGLQNTDYTLDDTDQAIHFLSDAGVPATIGVQVVQRWLLHGKIHKVGNGEQITSYLSNDTNSTANPGSYKPSDHDKTIRELNIKIKMQDEHLKGIEELHQTTVKSFIQERGKLKMELFNLEKEKVELQEEASRLLKNNLTLRKELLQIREELYKVSRKDSEKLETIAPSKPLDYRKKLGLSKKASQKEVLTGYKKLLKITHPDHGGNDAAFHYIKTDYDQFKNSLKG
ncbi:J domain-containing protein [Neobacillus jeddahensis]|uniref:J domain-containing protein n=1 Tax=Neobacillus jeddahensis TaxID=1461580 RepID=UPI00058B28BB|nr:J domain-containing protein [Neobacillus jeddahensis]